jgi:hypothetical protein
MSAADHDVEHYQQRELAIAQADRPEYLVETSGQPSAARCT